MKRYQVYLDPHTVGILDETAKHIDLDRSKILQVAADRLAAVFTKYLAGIDSSPRQYTYLDKCIGAVRARGKQKLSYARKDDREYLND